MSFFDLKSAFYFWRKSIKKGFLIFLILVLLSIIVPSCRNEATGNQEKSLVLYSLILMGLGSATTTGLTLVVFNTEAISGDITLKDDGYNEFYEPTQAMHTRRISTVYNGTCSPTSCATFNFTTLENDFTKHTLDITYSGGGYKYLDIFNFSTGSDKLDLSKYPSSPTSFTKTGTYVYLPTPLAACSKSSVGVCSELSSFTGDVAADKLNSNCNRNGAVAVSSCVKSSGVVGICIQTAVQFNSNSTYTNYGFYSSSKFTSSTASVDCSRSTPAGKFIAGTSF